MLQQSMDEILLRFPHLGEQIFQSLDLENLSNCWEVSKFWWDFINNDKIITFQLLIESIKKYCGKRSVYWGLPQGEMSRQEVYCSNVSGMLC